MAKRSVAAPDYQTEDDARHLEAAAEVRGDSKRHGAAITHLKKKVKTTTGTVALEAKVKKGLAAAFPPDKGE